MILRGYYSTGMHTWVFWGSFTPIMSIFSRRDTQCVMLYDLTLSRVSMRGRLFIVQGSCDLVFSYGIFLVYLFIFTFYE